MQALFVSIALISNFDSIALIDAKARVAVMKRDVKTLNARTDATLASYAALKKSVAKTIARTQAAIDQAKARKAAEAEKSASEKQRLKHKL